MERISSQGLIRLLIGGVLVLALWACIVLLGIARAEDVEMLGETEDRLLLVLQNRGLSGLTVASSTYDGTLLPPRDNVELAIWRKIGDTRILLHETVTGLAYAAGDAQTTEARLGQNTYLLRWPDVSNASSGWEIAYADVELVIGLQTPSIEMQNARRLVVSICAMSALFVCSMILINRNHQRRYARGLNAINHTLDLFAQGQTEMRVPEGRIAPEIDRLAGLLNAALSRIDTLTNGLRFMSAHLAHEINTPLQKVRVLAVRIAGEPDADERVVRVNEIDRILDTARVRQQNLMQLFRLEAGEVTTLNDRFDFSELVESVYEDFEDVLENNGRQVVFQVAAEVEISGNQPLMELLVTNLLTNASKYAVPESTISIVLEQQKDSFRLAVSNDGSVFPERVRVGSFRRFVRADDGGGPQGAGLGLNLVFAICQAHGFEVTLPEATDKAIVEIRGPVSTKAEGMI